MKRVIIGFALLVAALGGTAAALASGGAITKKVEAAGGIGRPYTFQEHKPAAAVVARAIVPPGASFGWHFHRADVVAVVKSGTLSLYDSADPTCTAKRYSAGQGFIEHRDHVHLARNEGDTPVTVLVTYLGLNPGVNPDVPAPSPGNCPF